MDTAEETVERLGRLRESGVRLHIDDFGTGYSSLTYLHRFPIDALKIDRSFVGTMERSPDTVAIVKAVLTLGHTLGLEVIAEGVETREQLDLLRTFGCDLGQGYYLSRPLAVADAERLIVEVRASGVPVRQLDMA
jgi:EAL domain-containing protein (putative c-di-GMP-specific phosphodiesterase class I)